MKIHGKEPAAMINDDAPASEEKITDEHDPAVIGGDHLRPSRRGEIGAAMRRPRGAVDNAAKSKRRRRCLLWHRTNEGRFPEPLGNRVGERARECRLFAANRFERLLAHLIEAGRHIERFLAERLGFDPKWNHALALPASTV